MRYRQSILRVASILLIILLTQKMVGGLYLHNWLHGSKYVLFHPANEKKVNQYNCSCIDDFYSPFNEPATVFIDAPSSVQAVFQAVPGISLPAVTKFFRSLRGPPVS